MQLYYTTCRTTFRVVIMFDPVSSPRYTPLVVYTLLHYITYIYIYIYRTIFLTIDSEQEVDSLDSDKRRSRVACRNATIPNRSLGQTCMMNQIHVIKRWSKSSFAKLSTLQISKLNSSTFSPLFKLFFSNLITFIFFVEFGYYLWISWRWLTNWYLENRGDSQDVREVLSLVQ